MYVKRIGHRIGRYIGLGLIPFSPSSGLGSSSAPIQWALDGGNAYESATIDSLAVLRSLESYNTYRRPRAGRCFTFDGINDTATLGARLTTGSPTALTVCFWMKTVQSTFAVLIGENATNQNSWRVAMDSGTGRLRCEVSADGFTTNYKRYTTSALVNTGSAVHVAMVFDHGTLTVYLNGSQAAVTKNIDGSVPSLFNTPAGFVINDGTFAGSMWGVRVYSVAKSAAEILAIKNQANTPTTIDTSGILAGYWCNDETGLTAQDWADNGKHLTLTNVTLSTFHATDSGVTYNPFNFVGGSLRTYFDGVDDYIDTGKTIDLVSKTITASFKFRTVTSSVYLMSQGGVTGGWTIYVNGSGQLGVILKQSGSTSDHYLVRGGTVVTDGVLRTAVVTINYSGVNPSVTITLNGVSETITVTTAKTGTYGDYVGNCLISARSSLASNFIGIISDVSVTNGTNSFSANGYGQSDWSTGTKVGSPASVVIPRKESDTSKDVLGNTLSHTGLCAHPIVVETPCITGDGTSVMAALGTGLLPASSANWSISFWYYHSGNGANQQRILDIRDAATTDLLVLLADRNSGGYSAGAFAMFIQGIGYTAVSSAITSGEWHYIAFARSGDTFTATITRATTGVAVSVSTTRSGSHPVNMYTVLLGGAGPTLVVSNPCSGRICDYRVTTGGVTTYFPLQGGPGSSNLNRDLAYVKSDGTYGIVAGAIVNGTVSNIWANRCPGYAQDWSINYGGRLTTENLLTYSEQFDNAAWTKTESTVVANAAVAPDGTTTADRLVESSVSAAHYVNNSRSTGAPTNFTGSVYAKADSRNHVTLHFSGAASRATASFNLANGTVRSTRSIGSFTDVTATITSVGNGWYRCTLSASGIATSVNSQPQIQVDDGVTALNDNGVVYTGDGVSGIYIWGAQFNLGNTAATYQPTTSAAVDANRFIPGLISGSLCADGGTKTLSAGNFGNPYSRLNFNYWSAPELTAIAVSTSYAKGDARQSVAPADTKFRHTGTSGDNKLLSFLSPLVGANKYNVERYTA